VKALRSNPYDGHTLATIPDMQMLAGNTIARILADKGYRGHNAPIGQWAIVNSYGLVRDTHSPAV